MFAPLVAPLTALTLGLAGLGFVVGGLFIVVLAFLNMGVVFDPRAAGHIKSSLLRVLVSIMILGMGSGIITFASAVAASAGGGG